MCAGWFIQDILSCIPDDSGTSAPSLLENSTWTQTCLLTQCTATTSTVSSQIADSGHKKQGVLLPQAPAITNLNRVDEWARIKNDTARSLSLYILTLQAESKIRHLIGSNNLKHLQDQRINLFSCRNPPDSLTSYLVPSVEPQPHRSAAETAVQRDSISTKQSLPAESLHGKPYINLRQVNLGLPGGQMCLLFQIKSTGAGKGGEISSAG